MYSIDDYIHQYPYISIFHYVLDGQTEGYMSFYSVG